MKMRNIAWLILGTAFVGVVVVVTNIVLNGASTTDKVRNTQLTNKSTIDNSAETLALVKDCVDPGGECYKRGQERTASVLGSIQQSQIRAASYAASCAARGLTKPDAIYNCVLAEFAKQKP